MEYLAKLTQDLMIAMIIWFAVFSSLVLHGAPSLFADTSVKGTGSSLTATAPTPEPPLVLGEPEDPEEEGEKRYHDRE